MSLSLLLAAVSLSGPPADTTVHLPRNGAIEIDTRNRDVVLRTGAGDLVSIRGGSGELDGGTLQVDAEERRGRSAGALDITVPAWARVEISSVSGNLTFTGTPAMLHAETVNGFIHVTGGSGTLELEAVAGDIVVTDFHGGHLSVDATGNDVTITNATGRIEADNVNGNVRLRGMQATSVSATTVNGTVEYEGTFAPDGNYEFNSQNRDITFTLPANVSARMRISTMNGQLISPQIPATTTGNGDQGGRAKQKDKSDDDERTFTVVFGSGAARVTVDVFSGNVVVKRAGPR